MIPIGNGETMHCLLVVVEINVVMDINGVHVHHFTVKEVLKVNSIE